MGGDLAPSMGEGKNNKYLINLNSLIKLSEETSKSNYDPILWAVSNESNIRVFWTLATYTSEDNIKLFLSHE